MKVRKRRVLICDCEGTTAPDARQLAAALNADTPFVHSRLCRSELDRVRAAVGTGEALLIACTQEAPLFASVASEIQTEAPPPVFADIRDRAGWSRDAARAGPKIAALLAEAAVPFEPTPALTLFSRGRTLVYGAGEAAVAAERLARRLPVTLLLQSTSIVTPPAVRNVPIYRGTIRRASGVLGSFDVVIDGFAAAAPSSRTTLRFEDASDGAALTFDLILDLSGRTSLFPAPNRRDGYIRVEPNDPLALERALFELVDLVGEFEKPRYLRVDPSICAHRRNSIVGCDLCLGVCPTGALAPAGDHVDVDARICDGAGACASVCPTGAIVFDVPRGDGLMRRLDALTGTYLAAGGEKLVLLVHDAGYGGEMITTIAREGSGLPAHVVPLAVGGETGGIAQIGLDFLLAAFVRGTAQVRLLGGPDAADETAPLALHRDVIEQLFTGLGYEGDRMRIDVAPDPVDFAESLYATRPPAACPAPVTGPLPAGKRDLQAMAIDHLRLHSPVPTTEVAMPAGAPFGTVVLDGERCTLCLACVRACPTGALGDDPARPLLSFREAACVQCGLCRRTCPEDAITLLPRLLLGQAATQPRLLKEDPPLACIRCGKPFASASLITRLAERMAGHSMFAGPGGTDILKMCEDCRVVFHFSDARTPLAGAERPRPRTTEDYLRERERRKSDDGT